MTVWLIAVILLACCVTVGYYTGAIRMGLSTLGLALGLLLAAPFSGIVAALLPPFGVKHPILIGILAPLVMFILIQVVFKIGGVAAHKAIDNHFKYKTSDTARMLFERVNMRVGICLGIANAFLYLLFIAIALYPIGYFTTQVSSGDKDSAVTRFVNQFARDMQEDGLAKAAGVAAPVRTSYYESADILGDLFHTPLAASRLATYPGLLSFTERPEFQTLANDNAFQERWLKGRPLAELLNDDKLKSVVQNTDLFNDLSKTLTPDLKDLREYLATGNSSKYDVERILGKWDFKFNASIERTMQLKGSVSPVEKSKVRRQLLPFAQGDTTFVAAPDNKVFARFASSNKTVVKMEGTWRSASNGKYQLEISAAGRKIDSEAMVGTDGRLTFKVADNHVVFQK